jgi:hypothetical protein
MHLSFLLCPNFEQMSTAHTISKVLPSIETRTLPITFPLPKHHHQRSRLYTPKGISRGRQNFVVKMNELLGIENI